MYCIVVFIFFFNDTATTEIYTYYTLFPYTTLFRSKRHSKLITLSGGMKRRVLIAKALSHEPRVLFLDEPTAGVDVELRRDMWQVVRRLRDFGETIILTTKHIEEAEEMADRIVVISKIGIAPV